MGKFNKYYQAEDFIESIIRKDFFGPVEYDEILDEQPTSAYATGILYPLQLNKKAFSCKDLKDTLLVESEDITDPLDEIEEEQDKIDNYNTYKPNSMAISFVCDSVTEQVDIYFEYGWYVHSDRKIQYSTASDNNQAIEKTRVVNEYRRNQTNVGPITVKIKKCDENQEVFSSNSFSVDMKIRKRYGNNNQLVTVSVSNKQVSPNSRIEINTKSMFQCRLRVKSEIGFVDINNSELDSFDDETTSLNLNYSDENNFSFGHGCSTKFIEFPINMIESDFIPTVEILQMKSREIESPVFSMKYLFNTSNEQVLDELRRFAELYAGWLGKERLKVIESIVFRNQAERNFTLIEETIRRINIGIDSLENETTFKSFRYMNEAMLIQRMNFHRIKNGSEINEEKICWYPFQIAFILMVIGDIVNRESECREKVDVLWFPTGGGKTEAYLGLIAFQIFFGRLSLDQRNGVTVIMRYTLRLLTAQQFERASSLIVACEAIRIRDYIEGDEVSIGLWVGQSVTPNSLKAAKEDIDNTKNGHGDGSTGLQVNYCPYCGSRISVYDIKISDKLLFCCPNAKCIFNLGLPIYIVDEDIYNVRPTLLISTLDKFARIVWDDRTRSIFGTDGKSPPPALVIQDELHLISGPLGSIAGIYETAIDFLCQKSSRGTKIIGSTATIKNSSAQIRSIYNRDSFQFPPSSISYKDSFFAVQASRDEKPARRYLGICESGGSMIDSLIRTYGCLIFASNYLIMCGEYSDEIIDQYYTIIGYFNSLRDLGGASSVIQERVSKYCDTLTKRKFKNYTENFENMNTGILYRSELTGRKSSSQIKDTLFRLEMKYPEQGAYRYVLASNMLSVGIDISRLGLMTVYSQPKSTSEYIQATSRVGRANPGLIVTLHKFMRTRDKSHFEQFNFYHRTFYKNVEPLSATPFSKRTIEKALHSVLIALVRHKIQSLALNNQAGNFTRLSGEVEELCKLILSRIESIDSDIYEFAVEYLDDYIHRWIHLANTYGDRLVYDKSKSTNQNVVGLLISEDESDESALPCTLNSLRNIEKTSSVYVVEGEK